ncbi:MAG: nicotinate (nicotinamide) nucleotide adenylyltransferase [Ruminococcus sp.]|jgi:nicotinate-nucleotide adenylyltransferase|nr:nicotinate (nicotinamide) nucleotide adenylyltransferase [Ruminococcus sp.]
MKIGIFGGTFDPPHIGHINAVSSAKRMLSLDRVIVVPAYVSPFKINREVTAPEHRLEMAKLAFDKPFSDISDYEVSKGGVSYTIDTIRHFAGLYPNSAYTLILGTDAFLGFDKWYKYREILSLVNLAVVARSAEDTEKIAEKERFFKGNAEVNVVKVTPIPISSSQIRENPQTYRKFLTENVYEYIEKNGLYTNEL